MKYTVMLLLIFGLFVTSIFAQTAEFTYQGSLKNGANAANGSYDFEFKLYDALNGGALIGTRARAGVQVTNGVFFVQLDFSPASFNGNDRFLEIAVKPVGDPGSYQQLLPRQPITYSPYSYRSVLAANAENAANATQLGGMGPGGFIQNGNAPQTANFNISGVGRANLLRAETQFNIGTDRVLSIAGTDNVFVGVGAGASNTGESNSFLGRWAGSNNSTGSYNSYFGSQSGRSTTNGSLNSFFGAFAGENVTSGSLLAFYGAYSGRANTTGILNTFFGGYSGTKNTTGKDNAFFGYAAGAENTNGEGNSYFGSNAGAGGTTGSKNSYFGAYAGSGITGSVGNSFFGHTAGLINSAANNSFFGTSSGYSNTTGTRNSFFGFEAGQANSTSSNNSFFGFQAGWHTTASYNSFFGTTTGLANTTGFGNSFFGNQAGEANSTGCCNAFFGSAAGKLNTTGANNAFFGTDIGMANTTGSANTFVGNSAGNSNTTGSSNTMIGAGANVSSGDLDHATAIGSGAVVSASDTIVLGRSNGTDTVVVPGRLEIGTLGVAGSTQLCLNNSNRVGTCSSSLRYKSGIAPFTAGLSLVHRLRPIFFTWKDGGMPDIGLGAEDVAKLEPLLATYNKEGNVEGVKYDRITVILLNAVKEQQVQIEKQQRVIDSLKKILCVREPDAETCRDGISH